MEKTETLYKTLGSAMHRLNLCEETAREIGDANLSLALQRAREGACLAMFRLGQIVGETLRIPNGGRDE